MQQQLLKTILIAANDRELLSAAMTKAVQLEHASGATLRVAATLYDPIAEEPSGHFAPADTQAIIDRLIGTETVTLAQQIAPLSGRVAELESRIVWAKDAAAGFVAEARRVDASLLIKPRQPHSRLSEFLHAPVDWRLMRDAPCPVLFTGERQWPKSAVVLAALDAADVNHDALNRAIIRHAANFQAMLGGALHLVTAFPDLGQTVNAYQVATDFAAVKDDMRKLRQTRLEALTAELGVNAAQLHVLEGKPRQVIEYLTQQLDAALVVLGTAARTGFGKLLIGNTAEDISRHLSADLLTVRDVDRVE